MKRNIMQAICLVALMATGLSNAMAGFRNAAIRTRGYLQGSQMPINTFAFGRSTPHNPTGVQQQTWWQRTKDSLAGRDYPYTYPQYLRDTTATRNAFGTNTAGILTTLGLAGLASYIASQSEQYKQYKQQDANKLRKLHNLY